MAYTGEIIGGCTVRVTEPGGMTYRGVLKGKRADGRWEVAAADGSDQVADPSWVVRLDRHVGDDTTHA